MVLLATHHSYLDPLLIGCFMPRPIGYLARDTLFTGLLGPLIRSYDAIPIDREGGGLAGIRATLKRIKQGDAVLMFPEGTRSPDGKLQPLKPGFIALVRRGKASIVPLALAGTFESWPRGENGRDPPRVGLVCGLPSRPTRWPSSTTRPCSRSWPKTGRVLRRGPQLAGYGKWILVLVNVRLAEVENIAPRTESGTRNDSLLD